MRNQVCEVNAMRKEKYHIYLSNEELKRVVVYLINLKNKLIAEGRYTDCLLYTSDAADDS